MIPSAMTKSGGTARLILRVLRSKPFKCSRLFGQPCAALGATPNRFFVLTVIPAHWSIFQSTNEPEIEPHGQGNGICVCMLPLSLILGRASERPGAVKGAPCCAAKRTLDGEDRSGKWCMRERGRALSGSLCVGIEPLVQAHHALDNSIGCVFTLGTHGQPYFLGSNRTCRSASQNFDRTSHEASRGRQ